MEDQITLDMQIEEMVQGFPEAVGFLFRQGLRCIRCGEPLWGTLADFLKSEGVENPGRLVDELNAFIREERRK
ncbi:MAG: DUF1858 domain-containing protein [Candidatus Aminicenantales bacterium]